MVSLVFIVFIKNETLNILKPQVVIATGQKRGHCNEATKIFLDANEDANRVMDKLNNRPRKYLGFKTPDQVFFETDPPVTFGT